MYTFLFLLDGQEDMLWIVYASTDDVATAQNLLNGIKPNMDVDAEAWQCRGVFPGKLKSLVQTPLTFIHDFTK